VDRSFTAFPFRRLRGVFRITRLWNAAPCLPVARIFSGVSLRRGRVRGGRLSDRLRCGGPV